MAQFDLEIQGKLILVLSSEWL